MSNASLEYIAKVLSYCTAHGEQATTEKFQIKLDTLQRYQRKARYFDTTEAKILLLDIETARMIAGVWRLGKQRLGPEQIVHDWFILGWSCKWLFSAETMAEFVTPAEARKRDDSRIVKKLWKLVDEADVIISHNGNQFDIPKINTRFILNGLKPPHPYQTIDTRKVAYKQFGFSSNKLDYLGKLLLSKQKVHTDYELWIKCENGDQEALDYMKDYCVADTGLLEEVYVQLRPWIKSHPNLAVLMDAKEPCCPNCGGFEFTEGEHYYTTPQNRYQTVRCDSCGAVNRKKASELTNDQRKKIIVPAAR